MGMGEPTHGHVESVVVQPNDRHHHPQTYWNHVKTLLTVAVSVLWASCSEWNILN